ncbi:MAG: ABC transporter substrate-binding protein [Bacteroidetes bacterium]|nr:ABC transporter substrate-binding protein [Bacteroidota bacterium]
MSVQEDNRRLVTDQMGRSIMIPSKPVRIISLVPSQTELLYELGLADRIVGQTIFCIHPEQHFGTATKVGGTKKLRMETIRQLNPDLIIGNKEENERGQIAELAQEYPVWMSDIKNLGDALEMIRSMGIITSTEKTAEAIVEQIRSSFDEITGPVKGKAVYLIWQNPWMAVGKETFIDDILQRAGYINAVEASRYPELTADYMSTLDASHVFLSSEPFPFREEHIAAIRKIMPNVKVKLVDGELFSWYGSRLLKSAAYLSEL